MPTRGQIAVIHIALRELHLSDTVYRDILHMHFHKHSSLELTPFEAAKLIGYFKSQGWNPDPTETSGKSRQIPAKAYDDLGRRPGMATPGQLRKIETLWMNGKGIEHKTPTALRHFLYNRFHVSDLRFVQSKQVTPILSAIKRMSSTDRKFGLVNIRF